ncbi:hypothetical protein GCM10023210_39870 [Chryseobacterium ginsengisoli]|uniref:Uncharacterized protein n=1 Tax=Chryseobacterium ginsengisoli TaxID=363853 RepID=A0ABP9MXI8_9FLAO
MKGFIFIKDFSSDTFQINVSQIKYIHRPQYGLLQTEIDLNEIFTRIYLDKDTIILTRLSVDEVEKLVSESQN